MSCEPRESIDGETCNDKLAWDPVIARRTRGRAGDTVDCDLCGEDDLPSAVRCAAAAGRESVSRTLKFGTMPQRSGSGASVLLWR